jgi:hydrogenase-4 component B
MSLALVIVAILLSALSGVPGLALPKAGRAGQRIAVGMMAASMAAGLVGVLLAFLGDLSPVLQFSWPATGQSLIGMDPLSAFFLVPVFLVGGLGSVYGLGYWPQALHQDNGHKLGLFWGLLVAGMALLVVSRNAWGFLLGWEAMALSAFFLVATEDKKAESRRAAFVYLVAAHIGTLALFGFFTVWNWCTGSYDLVAIASDKVGLGTLNGLFLLSLLGFGLKAGILPLHFWLPGAHANAPTHVSAILSGVVLKMGIYGLVRFLFLLPEPPAAWGFLLLVLGVVSAVLGVVFALAQHDLKRLLAYHSVENVGIILIGLGIALVGRSSHNPLLLVLGLAGCLLHVWNHSLFKSLLFFGAGSVLHGAHTKQIDQLGGLGKTMPATALLFLFGAVAIVGLPPLNGFVSEFFLFLGFFGAVTQGGSQGMEVAMTAPFLAVVGALALACFVKVYGAVFLGSPRTAQAQHAHESPLSMKLPMTVLAAACLVIGVAPATVVPVLEAAIAATVGSGAGTLPALASVAPMTAVGFGALGIFAVVFAVWAVVAASRRQGRKVLTWDCGYAQPTGRMQYTASSFAQSLVMLFGWVLKPDVHADPGKGNFPAKAHWKSHVNELVLDRWVTPWGRRMEKVAVWFKYFQQGLTQNYVTYIVVTLLLLLGFLVPYREIFALLTVR